MLYNILPKVLYFINWIVKKLVVLKYLKKFFKQIVFGPIDYENLSLMVFEINDI